MSIYRAQRLVNSLPELSRALLVTQKRNYKFDNAKYGKDIVLVDGVRTPFTMSGTAYQDLMNYELQKLAIQYVFLHIFSLSLINF